ncbi:MAG: dihydroneopterin aldolase [Gammaproteobacteria bacterium]|nr:dihydroneopterin aldolase [Gammaproteobacteria bacterium]
MAACSQPEARDIMAHIYFAKKLKVMGIYSGITLKGLDLSLFLGWPEQERAQTQKVLIDIHLNFTTPPEACVTDNLDETYCYDKLVRLLKEKLLTRHFHLIEHLGYEIYQIIHTLFSADTRINIRITKHPKIENLNGGVSFFYGDDNISW